MTHDEDILFREVQRFRQPVLWLVLAGTLLATVGGFGGLMASDVAHGLPWPQWPLVICGGLSVLLVLGMGGLFWAARLVVEVRPGGLYLRFSPFHRSFRQVPLEGVTACRAVTYSPVREYGGWGIKPALRGDGKAYNVSGNRGVRLEYADGRHLLIGSQRAEELAQTVEASLVGEA